MKSPFLTAAGIAIALSGTVQAQIEGTVVGDFIDLGDGIFAFEVTNNTDVDFTAIGFGANTSTASNHIVGGFSGNFVNEGFFGSDVISFNTSDGPLAIFEFNPAFTATNTFFSVESNPAVLNNSFNPAGVVDTETELRGSFAIANFDNDGNPAFILGAGDTQILAVLATSDGVVPTFDGGEARIQGFDPVEIIPEPGSLALLGLGGLAMLRRRR